MNKGLILTVAVLYTITGLSYMHQKEYANSLIWLSYAMANIGFCLL